MRSVFEIPSAPRTAAALTAALTCALTLGGCGLLGGGGEDVTAEAESKLRQGDIPGAMAAYDAALAEHADSVPAAVGAAYGAYLRGEYDKADQLLAAAEAPAGEAVGDIKLRRALVALKTGDTDAVRTHAGASGLPAGKLLVAEVDLADGEREEAETLLNEIKGTPGSVGETASAYLSLLGDEDPLVAGLAENYALWALGQRRVAAVSVEEVVKGMPDDRERKAEELLLWAGRAASVGESQVASNLLEAISFPPKGQAWRVLATRGIILCSEGGTEGAGLSNAEGCKQTFDELEGKAPSDGLAHARITASSVLGDKNPDIALALLDDVPESDAAALAALRAGDEGTASSLAPEGLFADYLEQR
ncbi:MAG: hypothetical protein H6739_40365 [Alphaproteobacteria bacterium]|nr:hypothetical protein [Alphaproteobacteria bacterium]